LARIRAIADYELLRELGSGSRGRYYLARRPPRLALDVEYVAVKVFSWESTSDTFRRVAARLRAFAGVRSPYLGPLYDVGQHDGVFYTSMEFLAAGSLRSPVQAVEQALRVRAVGDAARALAALHRAGLVHGAVKPGNVLLDPYGAKLSDPDLGVQVTPGLRSTGVGASGVEFTDPRLLLGEPLAPEHDVWSAGLLLHWVVSGNAGYPSLPAREGRGRAGLAALRQVVSGHPEVRPDLPEPVAGIVRDCLAPVERRPAAAEVADRIAAVAAGMATADR
jgi:eukaryotic-like serine/threonine-protein kinase